MVRLYSRDYNTDKVYDADANSYGAIDFADDAVVFAFNTEDKTDEIEATVIRRDDGQGNMELSRKEANDTLAWEKLSEMLEAGTVCTVKVKESVPSGVVAYLEGIRAFIPASQLALDYVEDTDAWIGKTVEVKVITADVQNQGIVLGTALGFENFRNGVFVQTVGAQTVDSLRGDGYQFSVHDQIGRGGSGDGVRCGKQQCFHRYASFGRG